MASLIIGGIVYGIDRAKQAKEKKKAHNASRFSELEKENAKRIAHLQQASCFCERSDWTGEGCPQHGHQRQHGEQDGSAGVESNVGRRQSQDRQSRASGSNEPDRVEGWTKAPRKMDDDEVARINEIRRKKGKRYRSFFGKKSQ